MTNKERTKAIGRYARRHGFSASTVRAVTTLRYAAIREGNMKYQGLRLPHVAGLPKGKQLGVEKTKGINPGNYDKYNLVGLSLGELYCIKHALEVYASHVGEDVLAVLQNLDQTQTIS